MFPFVESIIFPKKDLVARVGSIDISKKEFQKEYELEFYYIANVLGISIDTDNHSDALKKIVLDKLIYKRLMQNLFRDMKLESNNDLISQVIRGLDEFQSDGKFDYDQYQLSLSNSGLTEQDYISEINHTILSESIHSLFTKSIDFPHSHLNKLLFDNKYHKRVVDYIEFSKDDVIDFPDPTNEDLQAIYDNGDFFFPEARYGQYIKICPSNIYVDPKSYIDDLKVKSEKLSIKLDLAYQVFNDFDSAQNCIDNMCDLGSKMNEVGYYSVDKIFFDTILGLSKGERFLHKYSNDAFYVFEVQDKSYDQLSIEQYDSLKNDFEQMQRNLIMSGMMDDIARDFAVGSDVSDIATKYNLEVKDPGIVYKDSDSDIAIAIFNPDDFVLINGCYFYANVSSVVEPLKMTFSEAIYSLEQVWRDRYVELMIKSKEQELLNADWDEIDHKTATLKRSDVGVFDESVIRAIFSAPTNKLVGPINDLFLIVRDRIDPEFNELAANDLGFGIRQSIYESFFSDFKSYLESLYRVKFY